MNGYVKARLVIASVFIALAALIILAGGITS